MWYFKVNSVTKTIMLWVGTMTFMFLWEVVVRI